MDADFLISTVLPSTHPMLVHTASGHSLPRAAVTASLVRLHHYLAEIYGISLNHQTVIDGVKSILENPALGQVVLAWRHSDNEILGQVEIKKPFEVWYNARYWYVDNHVVFPDNQERAIGIALLDYVKDNAHKEGGDRLRLYVGHMNGKAKDYYKKYGFQSVGNLLEFRLPGKAHGAV